MDYKSIYYTHPGHERKINEDSFYACDKDGLWIVCDGMGGHEEGSFASHLVTDSFE
jgi:serine/threonine protein phosphatase PrpC